MCHTQFSVDARPPAKKHLSLCKAEKKNIFHRRQKENKRIFFHSLRSTFASSYSSKNASASIISCVTQKTTSKWNFLCSRGRGWGRNILWFNDVAQECLRKKSSSLSQSVHPRVHICRHFWHIKTRKVLHSMKHTQQRIAPLIFYAFSILNK